MKSFINKRHKERFENAIQKQHRTNNSLLAAVYLLTANQQLWTQMHSIVKKNEIDFEGHHPRECHLNSYTLFCCAKDLYLGEVHMTISGLADMDLVPPKLFSLICNAMAIRRYGLRVIH